MPPAASGSDNPRGKTPQKAATKGPKRTPRPDGGANGGSGSATARRSSPVGDTKPTSDGPGPALKTEPAGSTKVDDTAVVPAASVKVPSTGPATTSVTDPTVVPGAPLAEPATGVDGVDGVERDGAGEQRKARTRPPRPDRADTGRRKGRRVRRVIRRIDLWSVLKLAIVLYTCLYAAVMATLALLWGLAYSSGQIDKVQSFMADVGMDNYRFYGDQMWRACAMIGAIGVLAATVATVLTAALVNVISEMTGGIRVIVIEEDPPPRRR